MADLDREFETMNIDDSLYFVCNKLGGKKVEVDAVYLRRLLYIALAAHDYIHQPFWYKDRCLEVLKERLKNFKEPGNELSNSNRKTGKRAIGFKWRSKIFSRNKQN